MVCLVMGYACVGQLEYKQEHSTGTIAGQYASTALQLVTQVLTNFVHEDYTFEAHIIFHKFTSKQLVNAW